MSQWHFPDKRVGENHVSILLRHVGLACLAHVARVVMLNPCIKALLGLSRLFWTFWKLPWKHPEVTGIMLALHNALLGMAYKPCLSS